MSISLASSLTHRDYYWSEWKAVQSLKKFVHQYDDDGIIYLIYGYDLPEIVKCTIWKGAVPDGVLQVYSQAQNDADKADFESTWKSSGNKPIINSTSIISTPSFGAKSAIINSVSKRFFARNTGRQFDVVSGSTDLNFTVEFPWVKITGIECIGAEKLDTADLRVYDTAAGTYSGVPNYMLNQFGFSLNMAPDFYERYAPFDADLYYGMVLKINYNSISNKRIGINFLMTEVK